VTVLRKPFGRDVLLAAVTTSLGHAAHLVGPTPDAAVLLAAGETAVIDDVEETKA
jgi:hypothetical protein